MADTKQLLEAQGLDDLLSEVYVTSEHFQNDDGKQVEYNRIRLTFDNGDVVHLKATPELKAAVYYAKNFTANK